MASTAVRTSAVSELEGGLKKGLEGGLKKGLLEKGDLKFSKKTSRGLPSL